MIRVRTCTCRQNWRSDWIAQCNNCDPREGTVIGVNASSWHVHWDGTKYESNEFGSIDRDQVEVLGLPPAPEPWCNCDGPLHDPHKRNT